MRTEEWAPATTGGGGRGMMAHARTGRDAAC